MRTKERGWIEQRLPVEVSERERERLKMKDAGKYDLQERERESGREQGTAAEGKGETDEEGGNTC